MGHEVLSLEDMAADRHLGDLGRLAARLCRASLVLIGWRNPERILAFGQGLPASVSRELLHKVLSPAEEQFLSADHFGVDFYFHGCPVLADSGEVLGGIAVLGREPGQLNVDAESLSLLARRVKYVIDAQERERLLKKTLADHKLITTTRPR